MSFVVGICSKCDEEIYGGPEDMFDGLFVCAFCRKYRNEDGTYQECPLCKPEPHTPYLHRLRVYQRIGIGATHWNTQVSPAKAERIGDGGKWSDARQRQMRKR